MFCSSISMSDLKSACNVTVFFLFFLSFFLSFFLFIGVFKLIYSVLTFLVFLTLIFSFNMSSILCNFFCLITNSLKCKYLKSLGISLLVCQFLLSKSLQLATYKCFIFVISSHSLFYFCPITSVTCEGIL